MKDCKVNILGTEYQIHIGKLEEMPPRMKEEHNGAIGICNRYDKEIFVCECWVNDTTEKGQKEWVRKTLAHELLHAFLWESGLGNKASLQISSWSENEEMIDWFAIQSPKIFKVYQEFDLL